MTRVLASDAAGLAEAAALLRDGELVAFGTETVYGLGADATNPEAVAGLYDVKQRPRFNPLICHYPETSAAFVDVVPSELAQMLAAAFWPGPLTLVLPRAERSRVSLLVSAGLGSLAVRVSAHPVARDLLQAVARPIAAPSANVSGRVSPTELAHVLQELDGRIAAVIDAGRCKVGVESTVLDLTDQKPRLLRPGGLAIEDIEAVIGPIGQTSRPGPHHPRRSPGMMESHYAPRLPVRPNASESGPSTGLIAFGPPLPNAGAIYQLSERADVVEAASRLFDGLRAMDREGLRRGFSEIAVMPIPSVGLGFAINDRILRAAAPRH